MKKGLITLIVLGSLLTVTGGTIVGITIAKKSFGTSLKRDDHSYDFKESIAKLNIDVDTSQITFKKSDDEKTHVECKEYERSYHSVKVEDGSLNIKSVDERKWSEKIFWFDKLEVNVYLPLDTYESFALKSDTGDFKSNLSLTFDEINAEFDTGDFTVENMVSNGDFKVKLSTGNISLKDCKAKDIEFKTSTGDHYLNNVTAERITLESDTGKHKLEDVIASDHLDIEANTGDVKLIYSDGGTIKIKTSTGDVAGTILTDKHFVVETSTGKTNYPKYTEGPVCEIKTSTGDINIEIKQR